jgi:N-acetylglutamate synthase-like GNAT family acetyltransferase
MNREMLRIDAAEPADLAAVCALLTTAGLPTEGVDPSLLPLFVVLREGEAVRGAAAVERLGACGLLRSVVVADELRSQGYGARLTAAVEQLAAMRGLAPLYLLTTTAPDFFEQRGFRRVGRDQLPAEVKSSREFTSLCPDSAIVMKKP